MTSYISSRWCWYYPIYTNSSLLPIFTFGCCQTSLRPLPWSEQALACSQPGTAAVALPAPRRWRSGWVQRVPARVSRCAVVPSCRAGMQWERSPPSPCAPSEGASVSSVPSTAVLPQPMGLGCNGSAHRPPHAQGTAAPEWLLSCELAAVMEQHNPLA